MLTTIRFDEPKLQLENANLDEACRNQSERQDEKIDYWLYFSRIG
ncbi:hypothetical protein Nizo2801_1889 [Lactiplantibacillus plantarum]|nr:hypothetical protein Nizo2801_1889 [Lactiplantibacillus plantarum]